MTFDCEGWTRQGARLPMLILSDTSADLALQAYMLAEPTADVIRLTISDMRKHIGATKTQVLTTA